LRAATQRTAVGGESPGARGKISQHQQFHNEQMKGTPFSEVLEPFTARAALKL